MNAKLWIALAGLGLFGCDDDDDSSVQPVADATPTADVGPEADQGTETPDTGIIEADVGPQADAEVIEPDAAPDNPDTPECERQANRDKVSALRAVEATLAVKSKALITETVTFPSEAGDATVNCEVALNFKDLNANGSLEPYENWTLSPDVRAQDLVGRMEKADKLGLMAHATTTDAPTVAAPTASAATQALVDGGIRFGLVTAATSPMGARANWANDIQARCEASDLGVPFVLSMNPSHAKGGGRQMVSGFSRWPLPLGLAAWGEVERVQNFGAVVSKEYRAIGVRMALEVSADLATDPRWHDSQFTFGEDGEQVSATAAAYVTGLQGASVGASSVAAVVGHFPGAGATKTGFDARLEKGRFLAYPGNNLGEHLSAFEGVLPTALAVMPAYGVLESGAWSALDGALDGQTVEQVGASFNHAVLTDVLRGHYGFNGLVIAPWGVLEDVGTSPVGAPWGVESLSKAERIAKAVSAGVDQFGGLNDTTALAAAALSDEQIDQAAARALTLIFRLGLFENPYVDAATAAAQVNTTAAYQAGLAAMNQATVLLYNEAKPAGFLNGAGDGTQTGDKGNAGNGSGKVLPAPPGEAYVSAGCSYFVMGRNVDWDFVLESSAGYGELTNYLPGLSDAERIAASDYVFVLLDAPYTADPDSGALALSELSLAYADNDNADLLADIETARDAIEAAGASTRIIVGVDAGRPAVVQELLDLGVNGLFVQWGVTTKVFLDVAFGIVNGTGRLAVGLPASDAAAAQQQGDVAGDGQHQTFVTGFGLDLLPF